MSNLFSFGGKYDPYSIVYNVLSPTVAKAQQNM